MNQDDSDVLKHCLTQNPQNSLKPIDDNFASLRASFDSADSACI